MARTNFSAALLLTLFSLTPGAVAFQTPLTEGPLAPVSRRIAAPPAVDHAVLRVDSSLSMIPVHVTDFLGAPVTTLSKDRFQIFEDGIAQNVAHFLKDDAPVSIGILFDASGSMRNKMSKALEAAAEFFKTSNPEDEFFLIRFNDSARLIAPFTADSGAIYSEMTRIAPCGQTSLLDAIHLGVTQMKKARNNRKALVIVSDGGDNWSRHSIAAVKSALLESDAQVYAMGIFDADLGVKHPAEEQKGPKLLDELAALTGGRHYPVDKLDDLPSISAQIGREMRTRYLLGYYSTNNVRDGKYRRVKVKLSLPNDASGLHIYYRQGYFAPAQ